MTNILPLERWPDTYRKIPYGVIKTGYMVDPEDALHIIPNPEHIAWLEKGFDYLDAGSSLREVTDWLAQKIHKTITHQTLANLYKQHRKPFLRTKTDKKKRTIKVSRETKKIISLKNKARYAAKRADKAVQEAKKEEKKLQPTDFDEPRQEKRVYSSIFKDEENQTTLDIVFKPNPGPQEEFLQAPESEVLYGGAAGGEPKSWFSASFPSNRSKQNS